MTVSEGNRADDLARKDAELAVVRRERDEARQQAAAALAQQTATLEREQAQGAVLRIIAGSPTDVQPVLQAIADRAGQLLGAPDAHVFEVNATHLICRAHRTSLGEWPGATHLRTGPSPTAQAIRDARVVHLSGARLQNWPRMTNAWEQRGIRVSLSVPLLREGQALGAITVRRTDPTPFTDAQIALLQSFADQAVIAIENARLVSELQESLAQQTATAEVLGIISGSPGDQDAALGAITEAAFRLCHADGARVFLRDGDEIVYGPLPSTRPTLGFPSVGTRYSLNPLSPIGQALLENRTVRVDDMVQHLAARGAAPAVVERVRSGNQHSTVCVPLVRAGTPLGALALIRTEGRPFSDREVALAEGFAAQAVIAIENARLFNELQSRTHELEERNTQLTQTLEYQRATSEVLELISRAPVQLQVVLDGIVERATRLGGAANATVSFVEGDQLRVAALHRPLMARVGQTTPLDRTHPQGTAILERRTVSVAGGVAEIERVYPTTGAWMRRAKSTGRSVLAVPLALGDTVVGVLAAMRWDGQGFTAPQIALVETFATQAVIAIENARLFEEIQTKSQELETVNQQLVEATAHKSAFVANMSHELRTPLNAIIGYSEMLTETCDDLGYEDLTPDLARINDAGKHLLGLITNILDLAKIEAGKTELSLEDFSVGELVRGVAAVVAPLVSKNHNTLTVVTGDGLGVMHADQTKVRQALFNLLSNAAKFTEQGTITVAVARHPAGGADGLTFVVTDTGIGMTTDQLGRLFGAFQQAEADTHTKYGGTGLGLALSRECCRLMGGDITVTSTPGAGSTFTIRLPAVVPPAPMG